MKDPFGLVTVNWLPPGELHAAADRYNPPGVFTFAAHGNPVDAEGPDGNPASDGTDSNGYPDYAAAIANRIFNDPAYHNGMHVELNICNSGLHGWYNGPGLAQLVAQKLAALGGTGDVSGPNKFGWFETNPNLPAAFSIYGDKNGITWDQVTPTTHVTENLQDPGQFVNYHVVNQNPQFPGH
jgi:hypothetical protein